MCQLQPGQNATTPSFAAGEDTAGQLYGMTFKSKIIVNFVNFWGTNISVSQQFVDNYQKDILNLVEKFKPKNEEKL